MAEELIPETVPDEAGDSVTEPNNPEATMESARAQAEARRRRILEKANNRMKYVNGEQVQDEEEKKTSRSNAARIRAARQRRYGKKSASAAASAPVSAPATTTPTTESPVAEEASANPDAESEKGESGGDKEKIVKAASSDTTSSAAAEAATASTAAAGPTTNKKYLGVARMRRKMLAKKKMEEENNDPESGSTDDSNSAKASLSSDRKSSEKSATANTAAVVKAGLSQTKVQAVPIYMHMIIILLMFVAGFDVGVQQFHVDVDVRPQAAIKEYGFPFVQRNPWNPLEAIKSNGSKDVLQEKLSSISSSPGTGDAEDEFKDKIEYTPPNIDPIFRVDLDDLTKGPGFLNQMARGAIAIHRLLLWIFYYGPMGFFASLLSIPTAFIESPPGLFLAAVVLRQVLGKGILGAAIPEDSGDEGSEGKQKSIEVLSMAKNFVKNFFMTTFPTLVTLYDIYLHLKADMYVVLCGVFFGLVWTNLNNMALSHDADGVVDGPSEGEL